MNNEVNKIRYDKIKKESKRIDELNGYEEGKNRGFIHLFLKSYYGLKDEKVKKCITDGSGDEGIDAVYIDGNNINLFQFKFPEYKENKGFKSVGENDFRLFVTKAKNFIKSENENDTWNEKILYFYNEIKKIDGPKYNLFFVSYTKENQKLNSLAKNEKSQYIKDIEIITKDKIDQIIEKEFNRLPDIVLTDNDIEAQEVEGEYKDVKYKILNCYSSINDFYNSISEKTEYIFNANVRLSNKISKVFKEIKKTLDESPEKFPLLNNGITILCNEIVRNATTRKITLKKASIINGAHTSQAILDVLKEKQQDEYKDIILFIRIIEVSSDEALINEIISALNTHTKLNNTYRYSKDPTLVKFQENFNEKSEKYYLELKDNEYQNNIGKGSGKQKVKLNDLIQYYVGYYNLKGKASIAKSSKGKLVDDEKLMEEFINDIEYKRVNNVLDKYFEIKQVQKEFSKNSEEMSFVKTADILILFILGLYEKDDNADVSGDIYTAIEVIKDYIQEYSEGEDNTQKSASNITKIKRTFDDIEKKVLGEK